ncbi:hypothetical protein GNF51_14375, partial [Clostridium perfringens]|uniref:hypothetical protein n=1 Tax=Clostridium perfringens TaxID=1502 RepID=UPI002AC71D9B
MGSFGEIAIGFTPAGVAQDVRDFSSYFVNWEWSWKHVGWTLLGAAFLIPGVSELKKLSKFSKGADKASDIAKGASK